MRYTSLLQRIALFTVALTIPSFMHAAVPAFKADAPVTREAFLKAAVDVLEIPRMQSGDMPFASVPASLQPYVRSAAALKALTAFGTQLKPTQAITRGEAVQVLAALSQIRAKGKKPATYTDVKAGTPLATAVQIAVENNWLRPLRKTSFGTDRPLSAADATKMLRKVAPGSTPADTAKDPTDSTQKITIQLRAKERPPLPRDDMLRMIWKLLNDEYLYNDKIKADEAAYNAAEALVESIGDPYTTFMRPLPNQEFQNQLGGEVTGIGAQVEFKDGVLLIVAPMKGSPAEKANLQPADEILSVNGESLAGLSFLEAVDKVRGPRGSTAVLHIRRNGAEFDVTLTRDTIKVPEIEITMQNGIAIVHLLQFGQRTQRELRTLMTEVQADNPRGIILDLRNNPGGLLDAAGVVVSNFLPKGSVFAGISARDGEYEDMTNEAPTIDEDTPLVVLVNRGSASASEIVAGALQDAKRATIVGQTTFGKGTVQQVMEFADGSGLKMTIAEWFTPKKRKIDGIGVKPDIEVEQTGTRDEQLLRAIELLR